MKSDRLHAYEVLQRVAKVREMRASAVLALASAEVRICEGRRDEIGSAREAVSIASRDSMKSHAGLDLARHELLSSLDTWLAQREEVAAAELTSAEQTCLEHANASLLARRYREKIDEKVAETGAAVEREQTTMQQEDAIECWLRSGAR